MHPYSQGSLAAAQKALAQCLDTLRKACASRDVAAWGFVGEALCSAAVAASKVDDALEIDREMEKLKEAAG